MATDDEPPQPNPRIRSVLLLLIFGLFIFLTMGMIGLFKRDLGAVEMETVTQSKYWTKIIRKEGTGRFIVKGETAKLEYTGTLENGKVFDSSRDPGRSPIEGAIGVGNFIKGWDGTRFANAPVEAVLTMRVGERADVRIQPEYAYGKRGAGSDIPPDSILNFDVELLEIM
jgi:FKBP-type peptidyl-prolyl cis-trans isomerase